MKQITFETKNVILIF